MFSLYNVYICVCVLGIMFNVTVGVGLLQMSLGVPEEHRNDVIGLLGNFDGDKTNDFIPRYKTESLPNNSSDRTIFFDFGQKCKYCSLLCLLENSLTFRKCFALPLLGNSGIQLAASLY